MFLYGRSEERNGVNMISAALVSDVIRNRIEEMTEKLKNGDTQTSYQIGAQSFTEKEWDTFIDKFDAIQEKMTEKMREEHERMRTHDDEKKERELILDSKALFSICNAVTGETVNVYRSESFSEEKHVYTVKGTDINGQYYEKEIDADNINPNNCSYIEIIAWSVDTGNASTSNFIKLARMRDEAGDASIFDKVDYSAILMKLIREMMMAGSLNDYLEYNSFYNKFNGMQV